jgi:hypothetical protein
MEGANRRGGKWRLNEGIGGHNNPFSNIMGCVIHHRRMDKMWVCDKHDECALFVMGGHDEKMGGSGWLSFCVRRTAVD